MPVREFELFHGAVLTKLLRSEHPVALRLVETRPQESWSTYTLNDAIDLVVSHSTSPRVVSSTGGGTSWTFVFSRNQLRQMSPNTRGRAVWVALVCGRRTLSGDQMHVCLLDPEQLVDVIDFKADQQGLTVRKPGGRGQLRVFKDRRERFLIPQSRIDSWVIPGS
jgi:hypothetical protein